MGSELTPSLGVGRQRLDHHGRLAGGAPDLLAGFSAARGPSGVPAGSSALAAGMLPAAGRLSPRCSVGSGRHPPFSSHHAVPPSVTRRSFSIFRSNFRACAREPLSYNLRRLEPLPLRELCGESCLLFPPGRWKGALSSWLDPAGSTRLCRVGLKDGRSRSVFRLLHKPARAWQSKIPDEEA